MGSNGTGLTDEQLQTLKSEVFESLCVDRTRLINKFPFTGGIAMRLNVIPIRDMRVKTACTNGTDIFINIGFYISINEHERWFVLAHEVWHSVMMTMTRKHLRDHKLFNIAADMEINNILRKQDVPIPNGVYLPPYKLEGHSAEEIYEYLLDKSDDQINELALNNGNSRLNNSGTGNVSKQFDDHIYENDTEKSSCTSIEDQWGEMGFDPDFTPTISADYTEKIKDIVINEAQNYERMQGSLPAYLTGIINQIRNPEIKWEQYLAQFVTNVYNGTRRWLPPNRRYIYNKLYQQSRRSERLNCTIAIDTSGSCLPDLPKFFTELFGLLNTFGNYEINLIQCDADITSFESYDEYTPYDFNQEIQYCGGGGTSFCPPFNELERRGIIPDCFIYFTDGYGTAPKIPPSYPVLWVLTSDCNEKFCEWGEKIRFRSRI